METDSGKKRPEPQVESRDFHPKIHVPSLVLPQERGLGRGVIFDAALVHPPFVPSDVETPESSETSTPRKTIRMREVEGVLGEPLETFLARTYSREKRSGTVILEGLSAKGVSLSKYSLFHWIDEFGIPKRGKYDKCVRRSAKKSYFEKETGEDFFAYVQRQYANGLSVHDIADGISARTNGAVKISHVSILRFLHNLGVPIRDRFEASRQAKRKASEAFHLRKRIEKEAKGPWRKINPRRGGIVQEALAADIFRYLSPKEQSVLRARYLSPTPSSHKDIATHIGLTTRAGAEYIEKTAARKLAQWLEHGVPESVKEKHFLH